jgi:hypothetical protein
MLFRLRNEGNCPGAVTESGSPDATGAVRRTPVSGDSYYDSCIGRDPWVATQLPRSLLRGACPRDCVDCISVSRTRESARRDLWLVESMKAFNCRAVNTRGLGEARIMDQSHEATHRHGYSIRTILFWFFTVILAEELLAGSMWALLRNPFDRAQLTHLGYPLYMLSILGAWKVRRRRGGIAPALAAS